MDRREQLIQAARGQIQRKGYNGFSYADLADEVGIRKASIHHHFATKADLGCAVANQYRQDFDQALQLINGSQRSALDQLWDYMGLYRKTLLEDHKICLCMMLASDRDALPETIRAEVARFFAANEQWLSQLLTRGQAAGELSLNDTAEHTAMAILATLEGAMVVSQSMNAPQKFDAVCQWLIASLKA